MKKFFRVMRAGEAQEMYGMNHLLYILIAVIVIAVLCLLLRKLSKHSIKTILRVFAVVMLLFDPMYWVWEAVQTGKFDIATSLPLYYCSLFWMTLPIVAWCKEGSIPYRCAIAYLCTMNIIAGIFGLIINTHLINYSFFTFVAQRSLLYHVVMLFIPALLWTTRTYKPKCIDGLLFLVPLAMLYIPAIIIDFVFNFDYCYLNGGRGTPIINFSKLMPAPVFILVMIAVIISVVNLVFYGKNHVQYILKKRQKKLGFAEVEERQEN